MSRGLDLANRLAKAITGESLKRSSPNGEWTLDVWDGPDNVMFATWLDEDSILRGGRASGYGLLYFDEWNPARRRFRLPGGLGPESTDEEIDLVLSTMGY